MIHNLIRKELRLQLPHVRNALFIIGLWIVLLIVSIVSKRAEFILSAFHYFIFTPFFLLIVPLVFGISAVASEREHNVIDRQLVLPAPRIIQWSVKILVVLVLSFII
ncbi:MAG: ABC transporter permease, partial [bacterium]